MFNKVNLKTIRADLNAALKAVEQKHGLTIQLGNIRYSEDDFRMQVKAFATGKGNVADPKEAARIEFEKYAHRFGLIESDFGKKFTVGTITYTICGIKPRAKRYPVIAETAKGTRYKFAASRVVGRTV
jgi:hypothetical protein